MAMYGHTYIIYTAINDIFIEVFGHKVYLSMECVTLCVRIYGYKPQKSQSGKEDTFSTKYWS